MIPLKFDADHWGFQLQERESHIKCLISRTALNQIVFERSRRHAKVLKVPKVSGEPSLLRGGSYSDTNP